MNKLKLLDLFSGIGGFSLGLESTGYFQTIAFVEKDKFCRQVLQKNFNNIPIEEDIRNVRGSNYAADVITGGFPCQPFSVAGKRKGTDDDRYLWDETIRVVAECKPRWFIGENVEGLININNGMVLRQVQTDLEEQGFQVQCIVIPASGIGAWHQRKRIWIIAYNLSNTNNNGSYRSQRNETEQSSNKQEDRLSFRDDKDVPNTESSRCGRWSCKKCSVGEWSFLPREQQGCEMGSEIKGCSGDVPNSDSKLSNGCGSSTRNSSTKFKGMECNQSWNWNEIRSKAERCSEQTKSRESWWQAQSELCGVPNGISYELDKDRSNRIKSLGNSIVPQIARQIGLSIMKAELN
jgi:DNA-cytosine methyltransferase